MGDEVSFHLVIRNTGDSTLTVIPFADHYTVGCLEFIAAVPPPDEHDPALGALRWLDITTTLGDLPPGHEHVIIARFRAVAACPGIVTNCAASGHVHDEYGQELFPAVDCEYIDITPAPPDVTLQKFVLDPEVCLGDWVYFVLRTDVLGTGDS
ncbi:MAG: hypothetical protein H5T69_04875 [Chloroflexi bacterium]|nr:hypothetical protein [Chloroflexota bacterium]